MEEDGKEETGNRKQESGKWESSQMIVLMGKGEMMLWSVLNLPKLAT